MTDINQGMNNFSAGANGANQPAGRPMMNSKELVERLQELDDHIDVIRKRKQMEKTMRRNLRDYLNEKNMQCGSSVRDLLGEIDIAILSCERDIKRVREDMKRFQAQYDDGVDYRKRVQAEQQEQPGGNSA